MDTTCLANIIGLPVLMCSLNTEISCDCFQAIVLSSCPIFHEINSTSESPVGKPTTGTPILFAILIYTMETRKSGNVSSVALYISGYLILACVYFRAKCHRITNMISVRL